MSTDELLRCIGASHLLQPPLTALLATAHGVNLRAELTAKTRLAAEVLTNMAVASVFLPTSLGVLLALYPPSAQEPGLARSLAMLVSAFWSWRLYRQFVVLRPVWPGTRRARLLNTLLTLVFLIQGPGFGILLLVRW